MISIEQWRNNEQGNWMVGGEGMHNRLRNKERESFRRCPIQGYIFLWEEVAIRRGIT